MWSLPGVPEIGLASLVMSDGPVGVRGTQWSAADPSVALPSPTALAATWDTDLARRAGRLLGQEARRKGVHVLLAPTVNLHRSPLGGRHFEAYSEDPFLTGQIGAAYVEGVQEHSVATTVKHFVANDSETDRFTVDARVSDRALRELYLAPFETIVERGAWGVMAAYNQVNGVTMTEHAELVRGVLKEEWGFDGIVVSDWLAARDTDGDRARRAGRRDAGRREPVGRAARRRRAIRGGRRGTGRRAGPPGAAPGRKGGRAGWGGAGGARGAAPGVDRRRRPGTGDRGPVLRARGQSDRHSAAGPRDDSGADRRGSEGCPGSGRR